MSRSTDTYNYWDNRKSNELFYIDFVGVDGSFRPGVDFNPMVDRCYMNHDIYNESIEARELSCGKESRRK
jgi:hypothetical protein